MRGKIKKGIALVLSAVLSVTTCVTTIPGLSATVYAAGTGKNIQLGAGALEPVMTSVEDYSDWDKKSRVTTAQTVYYGSNEWRVIGHDGSGAVSESGTVTLFAADKLKSGQSYKGDNPSNSYVSSDIKPVVDGYYSSLFSLAEQKAINARTLAQGNYSSDSSNFCDGISDTISQKVNLWLLSTKEADLIGQSYRTASYDWWLRSPGETNDNAAYVGNYGSVYDYSCVTFNGCDVNSILGVRPAFNLNLSSIIFTSDAAGIKSSGAAGTLSAPGSHSTDGWKLTVVSDSLTASSGTVTRSGSTITVPFKASGSYDRISVFISDEAWNSSGAEMKYYGALNISGSSGTFTLPNDYDTSWKVYILAEEINDNTKTDYASTPAEITIPDGYTITCSNDGHGTAAATPTSGSTGTTVSITATPASNYQFKNWEVVSGGVTLADSSSSTTTFDIVDSNVNIKAIFEKKNDPNPKPDPKHDDDDDSDDGSSDSKPKEEKPYDYLDELRAKLKTAIDLGGYQTVTWDKGTALPYDIMKTLQDNPKITLVFSYTYENVNFKVTLPGQNVKAYTTIPWYGPLYLYAYYGGREGR